MDFYIVDHVEERQVPNSGISIDILSKVFKALDGSNYSDVDSVLGLSVVVLEEGNFVPTNNLKFQGIIKKGRRETFFALVESNSPLLIEVGKKEKEVFHAQLSNGVFTISENLIASASLQHLTEPQQAAWTWLESTHTGSSSLAMCNAVFPELQHYKLKDASNAVPRDSDDFKRCQKFIDTVPYVKFHLDQVAAISPIWANLIAQWDNINAKVSFDPSGANTLIEQCHTVKKRSEKFKK